MATIGGGRPAKPVIKAGDLLPNFKEIREGNQAQRENRRKARENKDLASDVRKTLASTPRGAAAAATPPPATPAAYAGRTGAVPVTPNPAAYAGRDAQMSRASTGGPARAALPTPAVAKGYQEGLRTGAAKVAAKAAKKATPALKAPVTAPSKEFRDKAKPGLKGALARNKGNNERLALERMKKASRKG